MKFHTTREEPFRDSLYHLGLFVILGSFQQFRIAREEGVTTLWRGAIPTMGRAMVVNAAQLASYSQAKQAILQSGESSLAVGVRTRLSKIDPPSPRCCRNERSPIFVLAATFIELS